jgi:hypothetical protein
MAFVTCFTRWLRLRGESVHRRDGRIYGAAALPIAVEATR